MTRHRKLDKKKRIIAIGCSLTVLFNGLGSVSAMAAPSEGIGKWLSDRANEVTSAAEDVGKWVDDNASAAGKWVDDNASAAGKWVGDNASAAGKWVGDNASAAGKWVGDNASVAGTWISENASVAGDWLSKTATGAWDWTQGAAKDVASWASTETGVLLDWAGNAWNVTQETVTGTWNGIFGKADDEKGPHHLCVSSPLFQSSSLIGNIDEKDGVFTECFTYADIFDITLMSTARGSEILPPSVGDMTFKELVESYYDEIVFADDVADGIGVRAMAQELRFKATRDDKAMLGRALGVWTDHYIVSFIITVDNEEDTIEESTLKESDAIFDLWLSTLSVYETKEYEVETIAVDDEQILAGNLTTSNILTANRIFDEMRFQSPKGGHGFAAEQANTLIDNIKGVFNGQKAKVIGNDNAKDGADRLLQLADGSEFLIQTKYHSSAMSSIDACFENGKFRYFDSSGNPMRIEVPADQYDEALSIVKNRIREGQIQNVSDPEAANQIVSKGNLTYQQARNIAKAGNIDSIRYDAVNGCIECLSSFGISAAVEFAVGMWNGEDLEDALKQSVHTGLKVGGTSFVISVLSGQLSKTALNGLLVNSSEAVIKLMGHKAAETFVNAFRTGGNIYGAAAMRSAAKMLRGNTITATVSMLVMTTPDIIDTFRGKISGKQLLKNAAETGGGIIGGLGGWYGGAALGSLIVPGVGTVVGGIIGSIAGGFVVQTATDTVTDMFVEDDADEMLDIISDEFTSIAEEFLLSEEEVNEAIDGLKTVLDASALKDMFSSNDRELYAKEIILRPVLSSIVQEREVIELPTAKEYQEELIEVMEDIHDEEMEEAS